MMLKFASVLIINDMKNKVLWLILIVSLAFNAMFVFGVVVNHIIRNDSVESISEASKPGLINPIMRWRIKNTIRDYIKDGLDDVDQKYVGHDFNIEKAYVCPFNEYSCVNAAARIINLKEQVRSDENNLLNVGRLLEMQPDNQSTQQQYAMFENRLKENKQAITTNERIILNRDTRRDGKFMGYCVRHKFTVKDNEGNFADYYLRIIVNSNGKRVELNQSLDYQNPINFDKTSMVIWGVLAER